MLQTPPDTSGARRLVRLCGRQLLLLATTLWLAGAPALAAPPEPPQRQQSKKQDPYKGLDHTGTPKLPPRDGNLPPPTSRTGKKRKIPNFDGRKKRRPSAGDVLIWVPRVIFFPVHVVLEYVVRWPVIGTITLMEKYQIEKRINDALTWDEGRAGVFPTILWDFGRNVNLGFYFYWNDLNVKGHNLRFDAGFWFSPGYRFELQDSWKVFLDDRGKILIALGFETRPDNSFNGLGPDSLADDKVNYRWRKIWFKLGMVVDFEGLNKLQFGFEYSNNFTERGKAPSVHTPDSPFYNRLADRVPGFGSEYNLLKTYLRVELDSRGEEREHSHGSGGRLELFGSYSFDPGDLNLHFFHWGGEVAGFLDVSGLNHVLSLRLFVDVIENIGSRTVPFTERIMLGGPEHLRGFLEGRFRGDSAMVLSFQYRWPVWTKLDANIFVSAGNAYNGRFREPAKLFGRMVLSWGVGFRTNTSRNVSFDLMVAFGSNQFRHWSRNVTLDNVRFVIGINQGF